jgi:hypothetical protein
VIPPALTVVGLERDQRLRTAVVLGGSLGLGLVGAVVIGAAPGTLKLVPLAVPGLLLVGIGFWRSRPAPVVAFLLGAALIDRYPDPRTGAVLAHLPFWRSAGSTHVYPFEVLLAMAVLAWVGQDVVRRRLSPPRSRLAVGMWVLTGVALLGWVHGLLSGGDFTVSLEELRPWLYLAAVYLLASRLVSSPRTLDVVLWALVLAIGLRAVYGIFRWQALSSLQPPPETILEHDDTVFFTIFVLLTLSLWALGHRGWLRRVATLLLPFVVLADLANDRRTAWLLLPACLVLLAVVAWIRRPERRPRTALILAISIVVAGLYVVAFRDSTGLVGAPAHALWSAFRPDPRDLASDNYRAEELQNLSIDIHQVPLTGLGFGIRYGTPIPMVDVSTTIDPLIFYIPHDTVLWVWLRMGVLGMGAFWWVVAAAVVAASRLVRDGDARTALFGTVVLAAMICYLGQGWLDQGLASLRIAALMGCLLGAMEAASTMVVAERLPRSLVTGDAVLRSAASSAGRVPGSRRAFGSEVAREGGS